MSVDGMDTQIEELDFEKAFDKWPGPPEPLPEGLKISEEHWKYLKTKTFDFDEDAFDHLMMVKEIENLMKLVAAPELTKSLNEELGKLSLNSWPHQDVEIPIGPVTKEEVETIRRYEGRGYIDACPTWAMLHIERLLMYIRQSDEV